jgi:hypothetical protein
MKPSYKASISSRASVKSLIVACMPAAAVAFLANSPALSASLSAPAHQGLTVDDNAVASTHSPTTNHAGKAGDGGTNFTMPTEGLRG